MLLWILPFSKKKQNSPLCIFLLIAAVHILIDITIDEPFLGSLKVHMYPATYIFLYGPLLYLYTHTLFKKQVRRTWLHFVLPSVFTVYYFLWGFSHTVFFAAFAVQYMVYIILIKRAARSGEQKEEDRTRLCALFITYSFGLIWLFAISANVFSQLNHEEVAQAVETVAFVTAIVMSCGLMFLIMSQPAVFMDVRVSVSNQLKYVGKNENELSRRMLQLVELFTEKKVYTNSDLNRTVLADKIGVDVQQLSREVNQYFKMNLSELINKYRIEAAKKLLENSELSIKEIYYEVGYNSRSAFNTSFKKQTRKNPSEYRIPLKKRSDS